MAQIAFFFLACFMIVTTVNCLKHDMILPTEVKSLHDFCKDKGHAGECWQDNRKRMKPHCGRTLCASSPKRGNKNRGIFVENMPNGLKCGPNNVCYGGTCRSLAANQAMPTQLRNSGYIYHDCYVPQTDLPTPAPSQKRN